MPLWAFLSRHPCEKCCVNKDCYFYDCYIHSQIPLPCRYTLLSERGLVTGCNLSSLSEVMFKEADWHGLGFASALSCWKQPPCCHQSLDNNTQVGYGGYMMQISHSRWHVAVQQAVWWLATPSGPNFFFDWSFRHFNGLHHLGCYFESNRLTF